MTHFISYRATMLFTALFFSCTTILAQQIETVTECEFIKRQKLEFLTDGSLTSEQALQNKLSVLTSCDLDAYDVSFFSSMNTMSVLLKRLTATKTIEQLTYGDLLQQMQETLNKESYQRIKKFTLISEDLGSRIGTETSWTTDRELFVELGASQRVIDAVGSYLKENPNNQKTYKEVLTLIK